MKNWPSNAKLTGMVQSRVPEKVYPAKAMFSTETCDREWYEFDVVSGNTGLLSFRNKDSAGGIVKLTSKERVQAKLHTLREKKQFPESLVRLSEAPGTKMLERFNARLQRELADLDELFEATWEKLRWDLLLTGTVTITGEDAASYDFGLGNVADVTNPWNVHADSTPITDLIGMKEAVRASWGQNATEFYIHTTALNHLMQSAECKGTNGLLTDVERGEFVRTGTVKRLLDMDVHLIDDGYIDDDGDFCPFLSSDGSDPNMLVLKAPGTVGVMVEGPAYDTKAPEGLLGKFVKTYDQEDPPGRWALETHTAMPGLTQPNKLYVATLW